MYNTILLAAALQKWERYSHHALAAREVAATLAMATSKRLHVLSVYDYEYIRLMPDVGVELATRLREEEQQRIDNLMVQKLDEYVTPLVETGIEVIKILRLGYPRDAIVQIAVNIRAELLIIGSHSKRGLLDIALGGTAQYVSRHVPCTVILVSPKV
jgi:nucleotide-binding universal stress UspA family protein